MANKRKEWSIENHFTKKHRLQVQESVGAVATNTFGPEYSVEICLQNPKNQSYIAVIVIG